jgi:hypothetical protein
MSVTGDLLSRPVHQPDVVVSVRADIAKLHASPTSSLAGIGSRRWPQRGGHHAPAPSTVT